MIKVAITGHRPEDLKNPEWVHATLKDVLTQINPDILYQGMAAGADLLSAQIAYELSIPFVAAKPWATHTPRLEDSELYEWVLDNAFEVVDVSSLRYYAGPFLYHARNEYMVDHADIVVAIWNGHKKGGTAACVRYANRKNKPLIQINPITMTVTQAVEAVPFF
jgi:uncharacterized phage-like protein YoqJ